MRFIILHRLCTGHVVARMRIANFAIFIIIIIIIIIIEFL